MNTYLSNVLDVIKLFILDWNTSKYDDETKLTTQEHVLLLYWLKEKRTVKKSKWD